MRIFRLVVLVALAHPLWAAPQPAARAPGRFQPDPKLPLDQGMPYVVLTTDAMAPSFQRLVEWKRSTGMPAQIISLDWLSKNPFYPGADLPEKMYSLLKDLRLNWRTRWIVLGGDTDIVPCQRIRAQRGEHGGDQVPSDVYFSDVLPADRSDADALERYGWNGNGDRFIGEAGKDGFDLVPEFYVGRIPVETAKEADVFFDKYFEYANAQGDDFSWLNRALLVSANQFKGQQAGLAEQLRQLGGTGYTVKHLSEEKPEPIQPIVDELNKGYAIFDFFGHGCPAHFWACDDHTSFTMGHVKTLRNAGKYPIVFGNSCNTNEFDRDDCFGESWLLQPKGGGIAYMGYTSVSYQSPVNAEIYRLLFGGDCPQLGRALAEAKQKFSQDEWVGQILGLLGDPEMWVRTAAPRPVKVADERFAQNVPARVKLTDGDGKPLRSARVLLEAPGVYVSAVTDPQGIARLGPPPKAGSARLSVLAQNGLRFEKKVAIDAKVPAGFVGAVPRPALAVDDSGEGNGQKDLNAGERARLVFSWPKDQALPRGTLALELDDDPFVKCETEPQNAEAPTAGFVVRVDPRVPSGHQVWMTLTFRQDAETEPWVWTFRQPVEGPAVNLVACSIDDSDGNNDRRIGWQDAGKRIRVSVGLFNSGTQPASGLRLTLRTQDASVTMLREAVAFGTLPLQDLVQPKDRPFEFQLAPDYDGHAIEFALTMEDDRKNRWAAKIVFTVPPAPPLLARAEARTRSVVVSWTPGGSAGVIGYHVYRGTGEKGPFERLTERPVRNATRFPDVAVKPMTSYWYVVRSVTADGLESHASAPVRAHTLTPLPKGAEKGTEK